MGGNVKNLLASIPFCECDELIATKFSHSPELSVEQAALTLQSLVAKKRISLVHSQRNQAKLLLGLPKTVNTKDYTADMVSTSYTILAFVYSVA
jgi:hypothetical protein